MRRKTDIIIKHGGAHYYVDAAEFAVVSGAFFREWDKAYDAAQRQEPMEVMEARLAAHDILKRLIRKPEDEDVPDPKNLNIEQVRALGDELFRKAVEAGLGPR